MPSIITIANQKGGVAKTTTTRHLADSLEDLGARVLVVDNDHQANLTQYFGLDPVELQATSGTMSHVITREKTMADVLIKVSDRIDVIPSSLALAESGARLLLETDVNGVIKSALAPIRDNYDVILIDCGPNLERLLINALVASSHVLIPTKTDGMSISGIAALVQTIYRVKTMNPTLEVLGVLPTIFHKGRQADEKALSRLREDAENAGVSVFDPIPSATNYDKAADEQQSVFKLYPETPGLSEYRALAGIILSK